MKKRLLVSGLFVILGIMGTLTHFENEKVREIYVYKKGNLIDKCSQKILWNRYDVFKCGKVKSYLGYPSVEYSDGKYMVYLNN
jgi:hypothetical protein